MCRFVCLGLFIALCLASAGCAENGASLSDSDSAESVAPADPTNTPMTEVDPVVKKGNLVTAKKNYRKANKEDGDLVLIVRELENYCYDAESALNSAAGSAPIVKNGVNDAKAFAEKYPKSATVKRIYESVKEFPDHVDNLLSNAGKVTKEACELKTKMNAEHGKVTSKIKEMTDAAPSQDDITDSNADKIIQIAADIMKRAKETNTFLSLTKMQLHRKFSTASTASHAVEELQSDVNAALRSMQTAKENLNADGTDMSEVKPQNQPTPAPVTPENPKKPLTSTPSSSSNATLAPTESAKETPETEAAEKPNSETVTQPKEQPEPEPVTPKANESDPLNAKSDDASVRGVRCGLFIFAFLFFVSI